MSALRALAPAKINLGLSLGSTRASDSRHEIVSVMQSISLADELTLEPARDARAKDEIECAGVPGPVEDNLAAAAVRSFRAATGWQAGPLRLSIVKRIPVAAGLGGGSADAAAALRLLQSASGLGDERLLLELAAELGADVPAQVRPGRWLASGVGELLERLPDPEPALEVLVLPLDASLETGAVYAQADRIGAPRSPELLAERAQELRAALAGGAPLPARPELLGNDLVPAARSLCELVAPALAELRDAGARTVLVSGSGPTVLALFGAHEQAGEPGRVAGALAHRRPAPIRARSVSGSFADPRATSRCVTITAEDG